jgi:hypothetical protein
MTSTETKAARSILVGGSSELPVGVPPRQLDTHSFASFYYSFRLGLIPLSYALFVKYMFFPPVILPISHYV